jgi:hypothetical protein
MAIKRYGNKLARDTAEAASGMLAGTIANHYCIWRVQRYCSQKMSLLPGEAKSSSL